MRGSSHSARLGADANLLQIRHGSECVVGLSRGFVFSVMAFTVAADVGEEFKPGWVIVSVAIIAALVLAFLGAARRELVAEPSALLRGLPVVAAFTILGCCPTMFTGPYYDHEQSLRTALGLTADEWNACSVALSLIHISEPTRPY